VTAIRAALAPALDLVRLGEPLVAEFAAHRLGPHSKGDDTRSAAEIEHARAHDWYRRYAGEYPEQFARFDIAQRDRVREVVAEVSARPASTWTGA
jgi:TPP-dependent pyruvate/acetoin dehydrogenase alpha subunit